MKLIMSILVLLIASSSFAQEVIETKLDIGGQSVDIQKSRDSVTVKLKLKPSIISSDGTVRPAKSFQLTATVGVWGALTSAQPLFHRLEESKSKSAELVADGKVVEQTFVFSRKELFSDDAKVCVQLVATADSLQTPALACQK